jgi:hypothetical protein
MCLVVGPRFCCCSTQKFVCVWLPCGSRVVVGFEFVDCVSSFVFFFFYVVEKGW